MKGKIGNKEDKQEIKFCKQAFLLLAEEEKKFRAGE
jgi:hypothetical protein